MSSTATEEAVKFDASFKYEKGDILFDASSYREFVDEFLEPVRRLNPENFPTDNKVVDIHEFPRGAHYWSGSVLKFKIKFLPMEEHYYPHPLSDLSYWRRAGLNMHRGARAVGKAFFDAPVAIPILFRSMYGRNTPVMSLTPSEIRTLRSGVLRARGKVLIGGLGLGWLARKVLEREQVTSVTVVDVASGVLEYFGRPLQDEFKDRINLVCGDVFKHPEIESYDSVLLDTWDVHGESRDDHRVTVLRKSCKNVWTW